MRGSTFFLCLHYAFPYLLLCQMSPLSAERPVLMRELHCSILEANAPPFIRRDLCSLFFFYSAALHLRVSSLLSDLW